MPDLDLRRRGGGSSDPGNGRAASTLMAPTKIVVGRPMNTGVSVGLTSHQTDPCWDGQTRHDVRSDRALLHAHIEGDDHAFGCLAARHRQGLYAIGVHRLRDYGEAEDAVQEALMRAFNHASSYRGNADVVAWLKTIMINVCKDRLRARKPVALFGDEHDVLSALSVSAGDPGFTDEIDAELAARELLASLPEGQREAIYLVDVRGDTIAEAAQTLGVPPGTVKSRCARGRIRLDAALRQQQTSRTARTRGSNPDHEVGQP